MRAIAVIIVYIISIDGTVTLAQKWRSRGLTQADEIPTEGRTLANAAVGIANEALTCILVFAAGTTAVIVILEEERDEAPIRTSIPAGCLVWFIAS